MSDDYEIWRWDEAEQRLKCIRAVSQARSPDSNGGVAELVAEAERWRRMYEAKQVELAQALGDRDAFKALCAELIEAASDTIDRAQMWAGALPNPVDRSLDRLDEALAKARNLLG